MLNQVILVGRVMEIDKNQAMVTIKIERPTITPEKDYDLVPILLSEQLAENTFNYIREGATIGVKASVRVEDTFITLIGEKVTFINAA